NPYLPSGGLLAPTQIMQAGGMTSPQQWLAPFGQLPPWLANAALAQTTPPAPPKGAPSMNDPNGSGYPSFDRPGNNAPPGAVFTSYQGLGRPPAPPGPNSATAPRFTPSPYAV